MFASLAPNFQEWLRRRGVPMAAAVRAEYLNRSLTDKDLDRIGKDDTGTFGEQAAHALEVSFDFRDTREGRDYWRELCAKLRTEQ